MININDEELFRLQDGEPPQVINPDWDIETVIVPMASELLELRAEVAQRWISVKDRLPQFQHREDCKSYLVYLNGSFGCKHAVWVYTGNGEWWREDIDKIETDAVTHWMPLPEPPESEV